MEEYIADAKVEVSGHYWMDRRHGVLLEHEDVMEMSVQLRAHPELGEGGALATRLERTRTSERRPARRHYRQPLSMADMLLNGSYPRRLPEMVQPDSMLDRHDSVLDGRSRRGGELEPGSEQARNEGILGL